MNHSTLKSSRDDWGEDADAGAVAGVLLVFSAGAPQATALPLSDGALELGRAVVAADPRVSRRHARVELDGPRFLVSDLGSQNGSFVDGERVHAEARPLERVLRIGDSLLLPAHDLRPFQARGVRVRDGFVRGPAMQALLDEVARASTSGATLHIRGESGTGKEGLAQAFHRASGRAAAPFVPVNCAAIPANLAERLLFGAKRGAYSGADADADGYFGEADGGTLFLDEIGELEPAVQVKLLRVLESKELLPLGATRSKKVDVRFCSATNKDLRALVGAGKLREDLYYRIGRPDVAVPPLRQRPEEIPFLIADALERASPSLAAQVSLVEACLLRPWPGNVRELIVEVRAAATQALAQGAPRVHAQHLASSAGRAFATAPAEAGPAPLEPAKKRMPIVDAEWRERIIEALGAHAGNVTASARALGLHRNQLRRLLERHGIDPAAFGDPGDDAAGA